MNLTSKIILLCWMLGGAIYFSMKAECRETQERQAAGSYGIFEGFVTNYDTGRPIYMARVKFIDDKGVIDYWVNTDSNGYYKSNRLWNGWWKIEVSKVGFITKSKIEYVCCLSSGFQRVDFRLRKQ